MKFLAIFIFSFCSFVQGTGQTVETLLKEAQRIEALPKEEAALEQYKKVLLVDPGHLSALSKCSQLYSRIGARKTNFSSRDSYYASALLYAKKALAINPHHDEANVSMAIALGKSSMSKSGKEKIKSVKEIKNHVDIALKTNPQNYLAWHVLGRWNYEVSNVGSLERAAAKVFYDAVPKGSITNAIMYLEKSRTLKPAFILNYYELARSYDKNNERAKAKEFLKKIEAMPIGTEDDPKIKKDARELLKKWA